MKKLIISLVISAAGFQASADVLPVEFVECSFNQDSICALVYGSYNGKEMLVRTSEGLADKIGELMGTRGRTFAMNVQGKVQRVKRIGGETYMQLTLTSLSAEGPRPR